MSIRAIAVDLYQAKQKVAQLEKDLEDAPHAEKEPLTMELKYARKEFDLIRKMLDGKKDSSSFRKRFTQFSSFSK